MSDSTSLKDARRDPKKMKAFLREHADDAPGDLDKLNAVIACESEGGEPKATSKASPRRDAPLRESE